MIAHQIAHREARARQVREALEAAGDAGATPMELTRIIYADVDPALHGAASRNVLSALLGMLDEGGAAHEGPLGPGARFRAA
jgi:hydroxyacylglutathione hydrolase